MPAYRRKTADGETWHYRKVVRKPDGTKVRVAGTPSINTKLEADRAERAHIERVLNPPPEAKDRRPMSKVFDLFLDEYTSTANNKASEIEAKRSAIDRHLRPTLDDVYAHDVTAGRIDELAAKLLKTPSMRGEGTISPKTVKNVLQVLRKALRWAKKRGWVDDVPEIEMPRVDQEEIRALDDAELDALLAAVASEPMWLAAVLLAADAGLRQGELRAVQWTDYNQVTGRLVVARSRWRKADASTKSRKPRTVPLTPRLQAALAAIEKVSKLRGPYVLSRRADGGAFGAEYMGEQIDRFARAAKIGNCGWHTLRHTFCTMLALQGAGVNDIKELAGHSSIMTTQRYMHVVPGSTDRAIALLAARGTRVAPTKKLAANDSEGGDIVELKSRPRRDSKQQI